MFFTHLPLEHQLIAFSVFDLSIEILREVQTPVYMLFKSNGTLFQLTVYKSPYMYLYCTFLFILLLFLFNSNANIQFTKMNRMLIKKNQVNFN